MNARKLDVPEQEFIIRLNKLFSINIHEGIMVRKVRRGGTANSGATAGGLTNKGYITVAIDGRKYLAHRLIWLIATETWPMMDIDHINGNKADNRIENLRLATRSQNTTNAGIRKNNTSGITGVYWSNYNQRWMAEIMVDYKKIRLGLFVDIDDAAKARKEAQIKYQREFEWKGTHYEG